MKLQTIENALKHYMLSADCSVEEREDIDSALRTCHAVAERYADRNLWQDSVQLITTSTLIDFLNMSTYDTFGKLAKRHDGKVPFEHYVAAVRNKGLEQLTNGQIECGYEFINDLWHDNEASGDNSIDGTFPTSKIDRIIHYLDAYHITNEDVLEKSALTELATLKAILDQLR